MSLGVNIETVLGDVLQEVDSAVETVLSKITINDVVQRLKPCTATTTNKSIEKTDRKKHYKGERITLPQLRAGAKSRRVKAFRTA
jgi:hypothetical protein